MELDFAIFISFIGLVVTPPFKTPKVNYFYLILLVSPAPFFCFVLLLGLFTKLFVYMLCFH